MSKFVFTSPEGKNYEMEGPPGSTKEQAFEKFKEMRPELFGSKKAEGAPETRLGAAARGARIAIEEPIMGAGELFPGAIGRAAAGRSRRLEEQFEQTAKDFPVSIRAGYYPAAIGSALVPVGGAAKAVGYAPKAARAAQEISTLGRIGRGAAGGAAYGALTPTGEQDYGTRLLEKGIGSVAGGVLGGVIPGVGAVYGKGKELISAARGKGAEATAESARAEISRLLEAGRGEEAAKLARETSELTKTLGAQDYVAKTLPAKMTQREAASAARHNEAVDILSSSRGVLPENAGAVLQQQGAANLKLLQEQRTALGQKFAAPAFEAEAGNERAGKFLINNQKIKAERKALVDAVYDVSSAIPAEARGQLQNFIDKWADTKNPMTFREMDYYRRKFGEAKRKPTEGFQALNAEQAKTLHTAIDAYMRKANKNFDTFLNKWKLASEKISGAKGRTASDYVEPFAETAMEMPKDARATYDAFIKAGTEERASELMRLIGKPNKETINAVRGAMRSEIENLDARQAAKFVSDREGTIRAIEKMKVPGAQTLRQDLNRIVQNKAQLERLGELQKQKLTTAERSLSGRAKDIQKRIDASAALKQRYVTQMDDLVRAQPKDVPRIANNIVNSLSSEGIITSVERDALLRNLDAAAAQYGETKEARSALLTILTKFGLPAAGLATAYEVFGR
jgi:hypothetical protein